MKKFLLGMIVELSIIIISIIAKNEKVFIYGTQIIGLGSIGIGAITSGLTSDNIYRRTAVEDSAERNDRLNRSSSFVSFGMPSIITLVVYYIYIK